MERNWRQRTRAVWAALMSARRDRRRDAAGVGEADGARRQSDWATAIAGYRAYLRGHPRDVGVQVRLVKTLYSAGCLDDAEDLLNGMMDARPDKPELADLLLSIRSAQARSGSTLDYNRFRRELMIPDPPVPAAPAERISVVVDARGRSPLLIDLTLEALRRSSMPAGAVVIRRSDGDGEVLPDNQSEAASGLVLVLDAGVVPDSQALGWLIHAITSTGAVAAFGDDDHGAREGEDSVWSNPAFHAAPHRLELASTPRVPSAVLFRTEALSNSSWEKDGRARLMEAFDAGSVAHVPLLLATNWSPTEPTAAPEPTTTPPGRILAIIPTRDEGAALAAMIESLEALAARPDALEIVVVDNGSRDPATLVFLTALAREGRVRVLPIDEPFNWSRLNNLAAGGAEAEILLFANNDMQMITKGWDDHLRRSLLQPDVGVVGARLVYPNGLLQHGGMALGALDGRPVHEGLGAAPAESGPLERWLRTRPAAAVTGAFMGVRREVFEDVGGFNAVEFAVGCNDIDFCLRVRERGWMVLYDADLELIHQESRSRGHDDTAERIQRARGELDSLVRIWGPEAARDPARNPHWINHETLLFHGVGQPDARQVEAWIHRSVDGWRVTPRRPQPDGVNPNPR